MAEHPIQDVMTTAMENLKLMIDVNTIIGSPVETPDGSLIMTVSKLNFGFAAGGSEFMTANENAQASFQSNAGHPFGGGSGGGVSIVPIAFLVVNSQGIQMLHLNESTHIYEKLIEAAPQAIDRIQQMVGQFRQQTTPVS